VFQSVVVPRWTNRTLRLSPLILDRSWPAWRAMALRLRSPERRESLLGTFAPLVLMLVLAAWVMALILGYGLALHALRSQTEPPLQKFSSAVYLAGESLLTIGFGDIIAVESPARVVLLGAAASGLAVVALVISLTFSLHGSFQHREVQVLTLDARAGAPPSGVSLLETYAQFDMLDELPAMFASWEIWSAEMLESHIAYPILPYFRSSHDNESWVSAMGAVLDAATLLLTTVEPGARCTAKQQGAAHLMYGLGCHAVVDLSHWFRFRLKNDTTATGALDAGVERGEFESARLRLAQAGFNLRDAEEAWRDFTRHRAAYAVALNTLAKHFATPPAQWIGDRSSVSHLHRHVERQSLARQTETA
jgi:Ion channel